MIHNTKTLNIKAYIRFFISYNCTYQYIQSIDFISKKIIIFDKNQILKQKKKLIFQ